jgi:hypothetical protein
MIRRGNTNLLGQPSSRVYFARDALINGLGLHAKPLTAGLAGFIYTEVRTCWACTPRKRLFGKKDHHLGHCQGTRDIHDHRASCFT